MRKTKKINKYASAALLGAAVMSVAGVAGAEVEEHKWAQPWDVTPLEGEEDHIKWTEPGDVTPSENTPEEQVTESEEPKGNIEESSYDDIQPEALTEEVQPQTLVDVPTSNEALTLKVPSTLEAGSVTVAENTAGNYVITSATLDNHHAATITFEVGDDAKGKVFKIKTGSGLEPVAHHIADGIVTVKAFKAGELVLVTPTTKVSDIAKSGFRADIQTLLDRGIFTGYEGKFNPNNKMTGKQFSATLSRALGLTPSGKDAQFYSSHNGALDEFGILDASPYVNEEISREEAFTALGNLLAKNGVTTNIDLDATFKDVSHLSEESKQSLALLVEVGAVSGNKGNLTPDDTITRGQAAKIIVKVLAHLKLI